MSKRRTIYSTKSGSYYGSGSHRRGRGKPVKRLSRAEGKAMGLLSARNASAAHKRKRFF